VRSGSTGFITKTMKTVTPFFRIVPCYQRRAGELGSPAFRGITRNEKHEMWMPAHIVVAQVLLLRHQ
jgi:hypothetical protein